LARFFDILASVVVCGPLATALVRGQAVTSSISRKVRMGVKHYSRRITPPVGRILADLGWGLMPMPLQKPPTVVSLNEPRDGLSGLVEPLAVMQVQALLLQCA
ncbi:MAG: hypothetical protein ACYC6F_08265, partial [Longimicrobiales bacterium]